MPIACISSFTRPNVREISLAMNDVLSEIADKYGLSIAIKGASYSDAECTFRFKAVVDTPADGVVTKEVADYNMNARIHSLPPINSVFTANGSKFRIVGWNSRARKYPINAKAVGSGAMYKFPLAAVKGCTVVNTSESDYADKHADDPEA